MAAYHIVNKYQKTVDSAFLLLLLYSFALYIFTFYEEMLCENWALC